MQVDIPFFYLELIAIVVALILLTWFCLIRRPREIEIIGRELYMTESESIVPDSEYLFSDEVLREEDASPSE